MKKKKYIAPPSLPFPFLLTCHKHLLMVLSLGLLKKVELRDLQLVGHVNGQLPIPLILNHVICVSV